MAGEISTGDYASFGHSVGAAIAFEACVLTWDGGHRGGCTLRVQEFVCGSAVPPMESSRGRDLRLLPDRAFLDVVAKLGELSRAVKAEPRCGTSSCPVCVPATPWPKRMTTKTGRS
ncbi:hypothetical protein GCM10022222_86320 [Amycolatopsis ultiminotia]|uniref:Uncharacterized protein n=1 Tax=Amycolatopsis ultiminotia TaxID=543629 RepID=A0ABP6YS50_9PSEU